MAASSRKAAPGAIHRISEFELEKVCLAEEFDILQIVGEGWFGKILLAEHRATDTEMVLKALPKPYVSVRDFYREFHYGLHLGIHKNIITTYDVAFETAGFYVFSQEYAPLGDLTSNLSDAGIGELHSKRVAKQLAAALDHLHRNELVHRDVKLDNVLVFRSDFSRIKLCDFGETRKVNTVVRRRNEWIPYSPPEVLRTSVDMTYNYYNWYNTSNPLKKPPKLFRMVSSKVQKMFRKLMEPRAERRPKNLADLHKYLEDRWLARGFTEKCEAGEVDELCPSMYSFHSNLEEKNKLLHRLLEYGIETTVDRVAKKQRIKDWIQNSIITEENEEEDDSSLTAPSERNSDEEDTPLGRRPVEQKNQRWSSLRCGGMKHINPRTGEVIDSANAEALGDKTPLSYDMQNIQPVISNDLNVRNKDADVRLQAIGKDSAYGSLDFKKSSPGNTDAGSSSVSAKNLAEDPRNFSSQFDQQNKFVVSRHRSFNDSLDCSKSPVLSERKVHANGSIASSKSGSFNSTGPNKGSSSTLRSDILRRHTGHESPRGGSNPKLTQNGHSPEMSAAPSYTSMKDTPYDISASRDAAPGDDGASQSTLNLNIVQGQIMVNPYSIRHSKTHNCNTINSTVVQSESQRANSTMN